MNLRRVYYYLREYLFPFGCGGCGEALISDEEAFYGLCADCRNLLADILQNERKCGICGKSLITEKDTCLACRNTEGQAKEKYCDYFEKLSIFFPYTGKFKRILGAYKFREFVNLANYFSLCLNSGLKSLKINCDDAAWIPVPPRPGKIKKQGWDQMEFLAGLLESDYKNSLNSKYSNKESFFLPVKRCLKRLPSRSQKELNREERSKNLKGRIICCKKPPKTAILFDDVITTGATLDVCASALLESGTEKVYGLCLFFD